MKRKYYGITSIIVIFVSFAVIFGYGAYLAKTMKLKTPISHIAPLPETALPDKSKIKKVKVLHQSLYSLVTMSQDPTPSGLKIFGYVPVNGSSGIAQKLKNNNNPDSDLQELFSYDLSMCFSSKKNSFCVIDNTLYTKNALLPDNGRVLKIEHDRVQIRNNSITKWIYLSLKDNQGLKEQQATKEKNSIGTMGNI